MFFYRFDSFLQRLHFEADFRSAAIKTAIMCPSVCMSVCLSHLDIQEYNVCWSSIDHSE